MQDISRMWGRKRHIDIPGRLDCKHHTSQDKAKETGAWWRDPAQEGVGEGTRAAHSMPDYQNEQTLNSSRITHGHHDRGPAHMTRA